jgi:hypothetical protein
MTMPKPSEKTRTVDKTKPPKKSAKIAKPMPKKK